MMVVGVDVVKGEGQMLPRGLSTVRNALVALLDAAPLLNCTALGAARVATGRGQSVVARPGAGLGDTDAQIRRARAVGAPVDRQIAKYSDGNGQAGLIAASVL